MEGLIAGYKLYIECQKFYCDRTIPSLDQYEQFLLSSASNIRQRLLLHIVNYSKPGYNILLLCELAALCPFYLPQALKDIQETPRDLTLWLEATHNGNLDRQTYATLFRLLHLLLSKSQSRLLKLLDVQMSMLQCRINRLDFTLPLLMTTRMFTQYLMEGDPWHNKIRDLKMIDSQFSTMVPSLNEFEKSCAILHSVQNLVPLGNYYLPGSFSTADIFFDLEFPEDELQAARNVLVWIETDDHYFRDLQPSLAIPTDLAKFQKYLATPHARIRIQYILWRLGDERLELRQLLLLLHILAALCPFWFATVGEGGDLILLVHALHTYEMTPKSFKTLHQILSIITFHNPPSQIAKDLQTIQKRLPWRARDFEKSLASAISYFQEMLQFHCHQVKPEEPLQFIFAILRALKYRQEARTSIPLEGL